MTVRAVPRSTHFALERLAPGVHAAIATPGGAALCNAGIVDLGGRTVVFDTTMTPASGTALRLAARRLTGRAPDLLVNSHWHGDHIWGNDALGGTVVSTAITRRHVLRRSRRQFDAWHAAFPGELAKLNRTGGPRLTPADRAVWRGWLEGFLATPRRMPIVAPHLTFEAGLTLSGSRRRLELGSLGGGHSPSDVFGFLPDERIVFAGDLVVVGLHPSVGDGWPDRWGRILDGIARLRPGTVVPGHGPIAPGRAVADVAAYLRDLDRRAEAELRAGTPRRRLGSLAVPPRYARWGFAFMYGANLARAYGLRAATARSTAR